MPEDPRSEGLSAPHSASLPAPMADNLAPIHMPEPLAAEAIGAQPMPTTPSPDAPITAPVAPELTPTPATQATQTVPDSATVNEGDEPEEAEEERIGRPSLCGRMPGSRRKKTVAMKPPSSAGSGSGTMTAEQRLLLLDTWKKSGLPGLDFGALVGVSKHTLYAWKKKFDENGPAGLVDKPSGRKTGSRLSDLTKRAILMMKEANPEWGCQRISDMLLRGPALYASPSAVAKVLHEAGYAYEETPTHPHPDHIRSFERAKPNELWQTDLFTFMLKRQNRRVHLVGFMDDHSRFMVSYGLHATAATALVIEVLRAGIVSYGPSTEVLTDNGSQYVTWRGKSAFTKELEKRGIKHIRSARKHPQTLGKIERFWGTLWKECIESAVFVDLEDARKRIGLFIDYYNFQRPHQSLDGLVPADRFFGAAEEVKKTLMARVAANALALAKNGVPKAPFYLTGQVGGRTVSVHAEGERVIMMNENGQRQEIDLARPADTKPPELPTPICPQAVVTGDEGNEEPPAPGTSPIDGLVEGGL